MLMCKRLLVLCIFYLPAVMYGQNKTETTHPFMVSVLYESMRTTHSNLFKSGSLCVSKMLNKRYEAGIGIETAFTPIHHDNGFVLYKLKFIPLFATIKYHFNQVSRFNFFVESSLGVSFNRYYRASDDSPEIKTKIKEKGLFVYAGAGLRYPLSKKVSLVTGFGIKGYKMSFNVLDINPHGISGMLGFNFKNL